ETIRAGRRPAMLPSAGNAAPESLHRRMSPQSRPRWRRAGSGSRALGLARRARPIRVRRGFSRCRRGGTREGELKPNTRPPPPSRAAGPDATTSRLAARYYLAYFLFYQSRFRRQAFPGNGFDFVARAVKPAEPRFISAFLHGGPVHERSGKEKAEMNLGS